jgi:HD-GYP domain-containing protein (c-di-GMP phosphodiesterase class II)
MVLDSYATPGAESLLRSARDRHAEHAHARRVLITESAGATLFLTAAISLAVLGHWTRPLTLGSLGLTVAAYMVAARVRFPVGSAWTAPTQLVFVPMLFILPMPVVPLVVAACSVLDLWPEGLARRLTVTRVTACVGDSFYSLGPVLVLVLSGHQAFSWGQGPLLVLAFVAQVGFDCVPGLARTWFAERIRPVEQLEMSWLYLTDACFSCAGIAIAASAVQRHALVLLSLPLVGLLSLFARERTERLDRTLQLSSAYRGAARVLGDVIDAVDHYTGVHTRQVVELSVAVTEAMGLDATHQRDVEFAALLHDVGKIRIPNEILNKPGKLDEAEWEIIRQHTIEGESMLKQVGGTLAGVGRLVRSSHERYDGDGYPDGLVGEAIPIESRIVCVCDAYNAMTTDRPYRAAKLMFEALQELHRCSGSQFDPRVVEAVKRVLLARVVSEPDNDSAPEVTKPAGASPAGVPPVGVSPAGVPSAEVPLAMR